MFVRLYSCLLGRRWLALVLALSFLFLGLVQWRVVTYVCGNDPMLYQRAGRVILQPGVYGGAAWRDALTFVAPGYPLLLAGVIGIFGDLAPYWSNFVFLMAALPLMWFVFRRLSGGERAAAFMVFCWLWIVFSGHPLHAPFLLYPFREVPRMVLVYGAYALLLKGCASDCRWRLVAAGLAMLAACGIREPSILILPGLLLGMAGLTESWRKRLAAWGWVLLPWFLFAIAAVIVLLRTQLVTISQFSVIQYLGNHDVALMRARQMLPWFYERMSWPGLLLVVLGIYRAAFKSRTMLAWFLMPAVLFFVFYAYMQRHDRYFLTTVVFLAIFAGYGLDWVCAGLERLVCGLLARVAAVRLWVRPVLTGTAVMLFAALMLKTTRAVSVWGPEIRARDVRQWQALVAGLEPSADGRIRVAVEQRCRYLEDLLLAYTDAELLDPKAIDSWPADWSPAHYFEPLNRYAKYATPQWLMYLKVYAHRIMAHRMNVIPAGAEEVLIGRGRYQQHRVSKWTPGVYKQTLTIATNETQVIWFDWGSVSAAIPRKIDVYSPESGTLLAAHAITGNGIMAIVLPRALPRSESVSIHMSSAAPIPAAPVIAVVPEGQPFCLPLGSHRRLSSNQIIRNRKDEDHEPHLPYWQSNQRFVIVSPDVESETPVNLLVSMQGKPDIEREMYVSGQRESGFSFVRAFADFVHGLRFEIMPGERVVLSASGSAYPVPTAKVAIEHICFTVRKEDRE